MSLPAPLQPGQKVSRQRYNALVDGVRDARPIGGAGVLANGGGVGTVLGLDQQQLQEDARHPDLHILGVTLLVMEEHDDHLTCRRFDGQGQPTGPDILVAKHPAMRGGVTGAYAPYDAGAPDETTKIVMVRSAIAHDVAVGEGEDAKTLQLQEAVGPMAPSPLVPIRLTGSTLLETFENRWRYNWVEVVPEKEGRWKDAPNPRTSASHGPAYNTLEANNTGSGIEGNGINMANVPEGFEMRPIGAGSVHFARVILNCEGQREVHFTAANAIDGDCE